MYIRDKLITLKREHSNEIININEAFITIITRFQLFEPCMYLSEDEEWLNIALISLENNNISQALSIRKSEITTFGIFNQEDIEIDFPSQMESEDLYQ